MATSAPINVRHLRPPVVTFKPSMWGDIFCTFSLDDQVQEKYSEQMEALKKEARSMLMAAKSTKLMILIDKLERLGLAYHFEAEIEDKLKHAYEEEEEEEEEEEDDDLFTTALRFRLLRQHQYRVTSHVFEKFVDEEDEKWKESLCSDVEGMLSLYEAAHVRIHDENILDEAATFTIHHLTRMLQDLGESQSLLKEKVQQALKHSIHRSLPFLNVRFYISVYERDGETDEFLLKLAKINFNFLQNIYRKELAELMRWWGKLDIKTKLPYARDRMILCFLWGNAFAYEPQCSNIRVYVAKSMQLLTTIDDTYDNYATLEEADLFTEILERWNLDEIDVLPDFMKVVYKLIMNVYQDFEREAEKQKIPFAPHYYRESVKEVGRAYNIEQKWIMEGKVPPLEEYMANSMIVSCIYVLFMGHLPGLKFAVSEEVVQWMCNEPKIAISTAKIGRALNDIGSYERENREGKVPTAVECYMKAKGVSKEVAFSEFYDMVENAWKDITAGSFIMSKEIVKYFLNYCRGTEVMYNNSEDGFTYEDKILGPLIAALYLHPLPIFDHQD